ncbi:integrase core domain-containing protein [Amycolatopsis kentuckyensis]|uniref:integrase core domain-containing protein n=1 Tax=Amycolatopsis kentuckyensis TaxID=218823 RepID=UPI0033659CFD
MGKVASWAGREGRPGLLIAEPGFPALRRTVAEGGARQAARGAGGNRLGGAVRRRHPPHSRHLASRCGRGEGDRHHWSAYPARLSLPTRSTVFELVGIDILRSPVRGPRANAIAERWVEGVRRECLNRMLVVNRRHLEQVLAEYVDHFSHHRPYRSLGQRPPDQVLVVLRMTGVGRVRQRDRLGGLIHEYQQVA